MNHNESINRLQLGSVTICYFLGSILRSVLINYVTHKDSWLMSFTGLISFLPVLFVYIRLAERHPGKSLFDIHELVYGPIFGRILSLVYMLYFLSLASLNMMEVGAFIVSYILPDTPLIVIMTAFIACCIYSLRKGMETLARMSTIFGIAAFAIILINYMFFLKGGDFGNFLPMFQLPLLDYVQSTHIALAIPYGDSLVVLMLLPFLQTGASPRRPLIVATLVTTGVVFLIHFRETIALGPLLPYLALPSYEVIRMNSIGNSLARMESLYALVLTALTYFRVTILLYACSYGFAQILRMKSYRPLTPALGAYVVMAAMAFQSTPYNNIQWKVNVIPLVWTFYNTLLPALTLTFSWLRARKLPQEVRT